MTQAMHMLGSCAIGEFAIGAIGENCSVRMHTFRKTVAPAYPLLPYFLGT